MSEVVEGELVPEPLGVRVTKHDIITVQKLEEAFAWDFNITEACQHAGIARKTYYEWLADDDVFSYLMSVAQAAPKRKAKEIITKAIQTGDAALALRYLTLRDPDYKPKIQQEPPEGLPETRAKIKDFLDDTNDLNDASSEPAATDSPEARGEVAEAPTDIS